jgi:hypothetical protein
MNFKTLKLYYKSCRPHENTAEASEYIIYNLVIPNIIVFKNGYQGSALVPKKAPGRRP